LSVEPARVVILISGRGSNMRALAERSQDPAMGYRVAAVISDQPEAMGLGVAAGLGIAARTVASSKGIPRAEFDARLAHVIDEYSPSLVALAGFMRVLSPAFVARYPGRILNIHPSLLPKYPGLDTHRRVIEAGDAQHGATVHFVTEELDGGPPIIQAKIPVTSDDEASSLQSRVIVLEHRIYPLAVRWHSSGRLRFAQGRAWLDGKVLAAPVQYDGTEVH
jgi:phosphoribosylglycinamide formyltransferase 1